MASLEPFLAAPSRIQFQNSARSKHSISMVQSRQLITDLENILEKDEAGTVLSVNRQINSGMVIDYKTFEAGGSAQNHLMARNGDQDSVFFSFLVLEKEDGNPTKVLYRWIRKQNSHGKGLFLKEEEHIYKGSMKNGRKHGEGEYVIIRKWSDSTETRLRFCGTWIADVFSNGSYENEKGEQKQVDRTIFTTFKSKRTNTQLRPEKNMTIKLLTQEMNKRKSAKEIDKQRDSNVSAASILNKLKAEKGDSSIHTIRL